MNLETLILRSLCALGMLVCVLVLGAMLLAQVPPAGTRTAAPTGQAALATCAQMAPLPSPRLSVAERRAA